MSEIFEREPEYGNSSGRVNLTLYNGTKWREARLDKYTRATTTIDYAHHEIHDGSHFFISGVATLSINNTFDMQFVTPNTTKWIHFLFKLDCESQTSWFIYEAAAILTSGAAISIYNNDRNSATLTSVAAFGTINASLAVADTRTSTASAFLLESGIIGAGKNGGTESRENEIILKQNTTYLFRAIAVAAGYIVYSIGYYEHTNREV